jgi:hypothetical protein
MGHISAQGYGTQVPPAKSGEEVDAAKLRQGARIVNGRVKATSSASEVGQYGNSKPKDDKSVRRARQAANDPRLQRAKREQEAHEQRLRELDEQLSVQQHVPYRATVNGPDIADYVERTTREQGVPLHVEDPEAIQKVATLLSVAHPGDQRCLPAVEWDAMELLQQGYHIERVAKRIGVPVDQLRPLAGKDGYLK